MIFTFLDGWESIQIHTHTQICENINDLESLKYLQKNCLDKQHHIILDAQGTLLIHLDFYWAPTMCQTLGTYQWTTLEFTFQLTKGHSKWQLWKWGNQNSKRRWLQSSLQVDIPTCTDSYRPQLVLWLYMRSRGRECSGKCHIELKHPQNGLCRKWATGPMVIGAFPTSELCLKNLKSLHLLSTCKVMRVNVFFKSL